jgi:hypothetical protein
MRTLRISFTVDEQAAGSVLADLADRVSNLDFNVIEEVPHTQNRPRQKSNGYAKDSIGWIILTATQTEAKSTAELKEAIVAGGFSAKSLNSALYKLQDDKHVKRVGFNSYKATGK